MPSITTTQEVMLLQLQYVAESCGLRRTYLPESGDIPTISADIEPPEADTVTKDSAQALLRKTQPDIEWLPSLKTYLDRVERLSKTSHDRPITVPEGFPRHIDAARVWSGDDFSDSEVYIVRLNEHDVLEVKSALAFLKALPSHCSPNDVSTENFPLPTLGPKLGEVSKTLHFGIGFAVIRGLNPEEYSPLDNILLYLGITSYIAEIRGVQDYDGRMLVHIKDIEKDMPESTGRPSPYTSRAQPFHTDRCDILSMYALNVAAAGGESLLSSSGKIYNEIAAKRPDVIHTLVDDQWVFDRFRNNETAWYKRQLLHNFEGHGPGFSYSRRPLTGAPFSPHSPGVPPMTEVQAEALDMVHFTASAHQLAIKLERGDIEIFNNFAMFHARNGFVDDRSTARHMVRLWLKSKKFAWPTPEALVQTSEELYGTNKLRATGKWDVHRAPPINRVLTEKMSCS